ncbi:MAG: ABC transporter permease subunit [FCB group bacterium]|nr:ABC transporter permease subunit [FCB group bacterium]
MFSIRKKKIQNPREISLSIYKKRWLKFKTMKRGYYSFIILIILYALSFALPLFINNRALLVKFEGRYYFPAIAGYYPGDKFNQDVPGEANYRLLREQWQDTGSDNWLVMPPYPFGPFEDITVKGNAMYEPPSRQHWLGTDDTGRDVFARLCYAFNISISFALILAILNYIIGISIGGAMGYFGGKFDLIFQRFIEIWSSLPMLFVIIIIASIIRPNFFILILIYTLVNWIGMTYLMRAEFYREKAKDYVAAALSMGQSNLKVIFKHILPNSLVPVITYFPFAIVGYISALVGLDYLGFGLPPPTPSWGQMLDIGLQNMSKWWMVFSPVGAQFITLLLVVFIGEGVREAFDPKVYSRLR